MPLCSRCRSEATILTKRYAKVMGPGETCDRCGWTRPGSTPPCPNPEAHSHRRQRKLAFFLGAALAVMFFIGLAVGVGL